MTKLDRFPEFFELCKKQSPNAPIDIQALSNSEKDAFIFAYLRDLGGSELKDLQCKIAETRTYAAKENVLNEAYSNVEQELIRLCDLYDDWLIVNFDLKFNEVFRPSSIDQAMIDAGHKHSDF